MVFRLKQLLRSLRYLRQSFKWWAEPTLRGYTNRLIYLLCILSVSALKSICIYL